MPLARISDVTARRLMYLEDKGVMRRERGMPTVAYKPPKKPLGKCAECGRPIGGYHGKCRECFSARAAKNAKWVTPRPTAPPPPPPTAERG